MGPRLLVGVHGLWVKPPMMICKYNFLFHQHKYRKLTTMNLEWYLWKISAPDQLVFDDDLTILEPVPLSTINQLSNTSYTVKLIFGCDLPFSVYETGTSLYWNCFDWKSIINYSWIPVWKSSETIGAWHSINYRNKRFRN